MSNIIPRPWHARATELALQRPPLTAQEIADDLGVTRNQVRHFLRFTSPEGDRRAIITPRPLDHQRPDHLFRGKKGGLARIYRSANAPKR